MNLGLFFFGLMLVGGSFWCKAVFERIPDHLEELRMGDSPGHKVGIVLAWIVTIPVFFYTAGTFWTFLHIFAPTAASGPC